MIKYQQTNREESGRLLQANVKRLNDRNYEVKSLTRGEIYDSCHLDWLGLFMC